MTFGYIAGRHAAGATEDEGRQRRLEGDPWMTTDFSLAHLTVLTCAARHDQPGRADRLSIRGAAPHRRDPNTPGTTS